MIYEIIFTSKFKKQFKKLNNILQKEVLDILKKIADDEILDSKYKDHKLLGKYKNLRECHIKPDLLLIYQKIDDGLKLYCFHLGSHSDLFK